MKTQDIEELIKAFKNDSGISILFGDRVAYNSLYSDLDDCCLVIQPIDTKNKGCYKSTLMQIKIIGGVNDINSIELRKKMESVQNFLNGVLTGFEQFKTLVVRDLGDEALLKNDNKRFVFIKRFNFYYS